MGVPPKTVSQYAKFEAPDPGYWCHYGYAVANVDPRGVGNSEGDVYLWGSQDAQDGYDFIEWVTAQEWCNGRATMIGNSGVCMAHWRIAATRPPHLACLAAWEGQGDLYRESYFCGGIPNPDYETHIIQALAVNNYIEDTPAMVAKYPLMNAYYKDKIVDWNKIRIPTYVTAGWVHHHLRGAFEGFRRIRTPKKWMRAHRDFEWPDSYKPENLDDIRRFFDRYCKEIHNGWEMTPRVRIDVMDGYDYDYASRRAEETFPLKRTEYKKLYLDAENHAAGFEEYANESEVTYDPKTETTTFTYQFTEDTEITGYMNAPPQRGVPWLRQHGPVPLGHQAGPRRQLRAHPRHGRPLPRRMGIPALQPPRPSTPSTPATSSPCTPTRRRCACSPARSCPSTSRCIRTPASGTRARSSRWSSPAASSRPSGSTTTT